MTPEPIHLAEAVARGASAVIATARALPEATDLAEELADADRASARGYFLPDEDERVRARYVHYLTLRAALLETLDGLRRESGESAGDWHRRLPVFVAAFGAACVLMRATRFVVRLAADRAVVWKTLDEADARAGIPRKSFTAVYRASSSLENLRRFLAAADFYHSRIEDIRALEADPALGELIRLLAAEEAWIERRRTDALKRLCAYRWFSFLRRHRSAWRQVMFGIFQASGSAIAELRQPGVKPPGAPKRITPALRQEILGRARPGDVFVTRHDDALSNLFLPGFWPHAALYLGTRAQLGILGLDLPLGPGEEAWFLEAKKDGVRFRPASETLHVDSCVVLRPPLEPADLATAIGRAAVHEGKGYDFLFDYRTSERLACTEVIYRGFHGIGPVHFHLTETGGRLCLPAEEMLDQAMDRGFRMVATAGIAGDRMLCGNRAEIAFLGSRQPL